MDFLFSEHCHRAVFFAIAVPCAFLDAKRCEVPRVPLLALIVFLNLTSLKIETITGCASALISYYLARKITSDKIGLGDVWMASCIGSLGGIQLLVPASLCAMALVLPCPPDRPIPFIPPLLAGTVYSVINRNFLGI